MPARRPPHGARASRQRRSSGAAANHEIERFRPARGGEVLSLGRQPIPVPLPRCHAACEASQTLLLWRVHIDRPVDEVGQQRRGRVHALDDDEVTRADMSLSRREGSPLPVENAEEGFASRPEGLDRLGGAVSPRRSTGRSRSPSWPRSRAPRSRRCGRRSPRSSALSCWAIVVLPAAPCPSTATTVTPLPSLCQRRSAPAATASASSLSPSSGCGPPARSSKSSGISVMTPACSERDGLDDHDWTLY